MSNTKSKMCWHSQGGLARHQQDQPRMWFLQAPSGRFLWVPSYQQDRLRVWSDLNSLRGEATYCGVDAPLNFFFRNFGRTRMRNSFPLDSLFQYTLRGLAFAICVGRLTSC